MRKLKISTLKYNHLQFSAVNENGANVFRFGGWSIPKLKELNLSVFKKLAHIIFKKYVFKFGMPDIIHAHGFLQAGIAAVALKEKYAIPVVITEHSSAFVKGVISKWEQEIISKHENKVDRIVAVSSSLARAMNCVGMAAPMNVIPNVVDTHFFCLPPKIKGEGVFRFVTIALLTKIKGIDMLLKAFAKSFKGNAEVVLEVCGDGVERNSLESLCDNLGIQAQVTFLGMLNENEVREALWKADAFVSSSHVETFGVVLIEAMSTGLPVVATRSGGPDEFVPTHLGCGLVAPGDFRLLSSSMKRQIDNRREILGFRAKIREHIIQNFSKDVVGSALLELYEKTV